MTNFDKKLKSFDLALDFEGNLEQIKVFFRDASFISKVKFLWNRAHKIKLMDSSIQLNIDFKSNLD